ncbi:MAG TPA: hypothetical protein VJ529_01800, partial [Candidatus Bathyarchaeia archaeon]|nr:hypothetical protein [Candidatus Bathyarchaeia archaeon]
MILEKASKLDPVEALGYELLAKLILLKMIFLQTTGLCTGSGVEMRTRRLCGKGWRRREDENSTCHEGCQKKPGTHP